MYTHCCYKLDILAKGHRASSRTYLLTQCFAWLRICILAIISIPLYAGPSAAKFSRHISIHSVFMYDKLHILNTWAGSCNSLETALFLQDTSSYYKTCKVVITLDASHIVCFLAWCQCISGLLASIANYHGTVNWMKVKQRTPNSSILPCGHLVSIIPKSLRVLISQDSSRIVCFRIWYQCIFDQLS